MLHCHLDLLKIYTRKCKKNPDKPYIIISGVVLILYNHYPWFPALFCIKILIFTFMFFVAHYKDSKHCWLFSFRLHKQNVSVVPLWCWHHDIISTFSQSTFTMSDLCMKRNRQMLIVVSFVIVECDCNLILADVFHHCIMAQINEDVHLSHEL